MKASKISSRFRWGSPTAGAGVIRFEVGTSGCGSAPLGHTHARHLEARVERRSWWCGCGRVPSVAGGRAGRFRTEPYRRQRCVETDAGWHGGPHYASDDGGTGSGVPQRSWVVRGGGPSRKRTERLSWSEVVPVAGTFG